MMDPKEPSPPFFFWDGDENLTRLIENILTLMSKFSSAPEEELKEIISMTVLTVIKRKYANFEFTIEFDENGIFHLKHDNDDFLPVLSTGVPDCDCGYHCWQQSTKQSPPISHLS